MNTIRPVDRRIIYNVHYLTTQQYKVILPNNIPLTLLSNLGIQTNEKANYQNYRPQIARLAIPSLVAQF